MTPEPIPTPDLIAQARELGGLTYPPLADLLTALADRLAELADLEPVGRVLAAMEQHRWADLIISWDSEDPRKWAAGIRREGALRPFVGPHGSDTPLAALAAAVASEGRERSELAPEAGVGDE